MVTNRRGGGGDKRGVVKNVGGTFLHQVRGGAWPITGPKEERFSPPGGFLKKNSFAAVFALVLGGLFVLVVDFFGAQGAQPAADKKSSTKKKGRPEHRNPPRQEDK